MNKPHSIQALKIDSTTSPTYRHEYLTLPTINVGAIKPKKISKTSVSLLGGAIAALGLSFQNPANAEDWFAEIEAGAGMNSNVFLQTEDELQQNSEGYEASDMVKYLSAFGSYEFMELEKTDSKVFIDNYIEQLHNNELKNHSIMVSVPFSHYMDDVRLRYSPTFMQFRIDNEAAMTYRSHQFDSTKKLGRSMLGASFRFTRKIPEMIDYESSKGLSQDLTFYWSARWPGQSVRFSYGHSNNQYVETLDGDNSNTSDYISGSYRFYRGKHSGNFTAKLKHIDYVADPYTVSDFSDVLLKLQYSHSIKLSKSASLELESSYTVNNSDNGVESQRFGFGRFGSFQDALTEEPEQDYNQWINTIGVSWSF